MKKKNVIMLIVDSLNYRELGNTTYGESVTPFLDELRKKSIFATNLYSQGPYTEAGLKGLLCGQNVLDDCGYMYRFNKASEFILDDFYHEDYEIYNAFYPLNLYKKSFWEEIEHPYFTVGFEYKGFWLYRIEGQYMDLFRQGKLDEKDWSVIEELVERVFETVDAFFPNNKEEINSDKYYFLRNRLMECDLKKNREIIRVEKEKFYSDKRKYCYEIFEQGETHALFQIKSGEMQYETDGRILREIWDENKALFKKLEKKQIKQALRLRGIDRKQLFKDGLKYIFQKKRSPYLGNFLGILRDTKVYEQLFQLKEIQTIPSLHKQLELVYSTVKKREQCKEPDRPYFFMIHTEEAHYTPSYVSYDTENKELLQSEMRLLEESLNTLNENFRGFLSYRCALRYIDHCIEEFFSNMEKSDLLNDTVILITADHGSSYGNLPLRKVPRVTNNHTENYHIPMFLYAKDQQPKEVDAYYTSKDVLPTLLDVCGLPKPKGLVGDSMLNSDYRPESAHAEYLGAGCPDIRRRNICYSIRNNKYLVAYEVKASEKFEDGKIVEVYDLEKDPDELHDLKDTIDKGKIEALLSELKVRHQQIRENYLKGKY